MYVVGVHHHLGHLAPAGFKRLRILPLYVPVIGFSSPLLVFPNPHP